ncbi:MAG: MFS transporter [Alphaproteobacteria bacterium]
MSRFRGLVFRHTSRRLFYGWVILAAAAVSFFASGPGQSHTFGVFIGPIGDELGLSGTAIASAYALATLAAALALPRLGRLVDRYGVRRTLVVVALLLGTACAAFGAATGATSLALGFAALRLLGQGALMLLCATLVAHWFVARRGFAMGLMALGFAASMALHPPLAQWLVEAVGWRQAWLWLGLLTWVLLLPLALAVIHDRPEELGLEPDGGARPDPASPAGSGADEGTGEGTASAETGLTLGAALRTRAFWIVAAALFTPSLVITALFFFQVSIFAAQGLGQAAAARVFTVSGVVMALCMPLVGRALDRFPTPYVLAAALLLLAVTTVTATRVDDAATALAYGVLFGANNAANITFFGYMWARYFGRRHLGSIQGAGQMIGVVGASAGPLPLAIAFDLSGDYQEAMLMLAALPLICAILVLFLREPPGMAGPGRGDRGMTTGA